MGVRLGRVGARVFEVPWWGLLRQMTLRVIKMRHGSVPVSTEEESSGKVHHG